MTGLLSLPPELLLKIIQTCPKRDRCCLRGTCKRMNELADPIVFRRICLFVWNPHITEHQFTTVATWPPKTCEFTREIMFPFIPFRPQASELSWHHFGPCDDLRVHLPTAISKLRNLTRFTWNISDGDPSWLVNSLLHAVARLPRLTDLNIRWDECEALIPVGLCSNLSILSVSCGRDNHRSFISQMATVIANSPHLKSLNVRYWRSLPIGVPLPTLSDLFGKLSTKNPLLLEHLSIKLMDATVNEVTLPHLTHLTSFEFQCEDENLATRVWTSFLVNHIRLSDVVIQGTMTTETVSYLLPFSGLKKLVVGYDVGMDTENLRNMLFEEILPKHVNSLQTLRISGRFYGFYDYARLKSITSYLKLRDLAVRIDGKKGMTVQLLLDTVARLPELKILRVWMEDSPPWWGPGPANFKPNPELPYAEELEVECIEERKFSQRRYVLKKDGECPVGYREIPWFDGI